jgi:transcriptional regulator with XRE-family HTH domain
MKTTIARNQDIKLAVFSPSAADEVRRLPRLVGWLYKAAAKRGESKIELARRLGITYGYLAQLASGMCATEGIAPSLSRSCAAYLGVPPVAVMLAAGRIQPLDFLLPESGRSLAMQLNAGLERIAADPLVGCLMPSEVWDVPDSVKGMLVALYEDATQQELFPARQLPGLLQSLQDGALVLHDLDAADESVITDGPGSMRTLPI